MTWSTNREGAATSSLDGSSQEPRGSTSDHAASCASSQGSLERQITIVRLQRFSPIAFTWVPGLLPRNTLFPLHCKARRSGRRQEEENRVERSLKPIYIRSSSPLSPLPSPVSTSLLHLVFCAQRVMEGARCGGGATCNSGVNKEGRKGGTTKPRHGRIKRRIFSELLRGISLLANLIKNYFLG